jgi:hypothetical protein
MDSSGVKIGTTLRPLKKIKIAEVNEIDVTEAWGCLEFVSPPKVRSYSSVVTYFILVRAVHF